MNRHHLNVCINILSRWQPCSEVVMHHTCGFYLIEMKMGQQNSQSFFFFFSSHNVIRKKIEVEFTPQSALTTQKIKNLLCQVCFVVIQLLSPVQLYDSGTQPICPFSTWSLPRLRSTESVKTSNHPCLQSLPSVFQFCNILGCLLNADYSRVRV